MESLDQKALSTVELLILDNDQFKSTSAWCQRNMSDAPLPLDGATINIVDTFNYYNNMGDKFSGAHHSVQFHQVIVCGGADDKYVIQNKCR